MKKHRLLRSLLIIFGLATAARAGAQTLITSVPYAINASGKYKLASNLSTTTAVAAITVNVANVSIDLNEFFVSGPGSTQGTANPVIDVADVGNVTLLNGTVANGSYGIKFNGNANAGNYHVEKVNFTRCYLAGVYIANSAPGSVIFSNKFSNIGGGTALATNTVAAIRTRGGGVRIEDNAIATVAVATGSSADSYGIECLSTDFAIHNSISTSHIGLYMYTGGKYLNNLTSSCDIPFLGAGTNATGND